jgi:hypothetical protein
VKEDPRAWWKYAYFCVKKATTSLGIAEVLTMFHKRRRYILLFEKVLKHTQAQASATAAAAAAKKKKEVDPSPGILAGAPGLTKEEQVCVYVCVIVCVCVCRL